jgi:hypothetical protein
VITEAATQVSNVKALAYLKALALDEGESNLDITIHQLVARLLHLASGSGHEAHPAGGAKGRLIHLRIVSPQGTRLSGLEPPGPGS